MLARRHSVIFRKPSTVRAKVSLCFAYLLQDLWTSPFAYKVYSKYKTVFREFYLFLPWRKMLVCTYLFYSEHVKQLARSQRVPLFSLSQINRRLLSRRNSGNVFFHSRYETRAMSINRIKLSVMHHREGALCFRFWLRCDFLCLAPVIACDQLLYQRSFTLQFHTDLDMYLLFPLLGLYQVL